MLFCVAATALAQDIEVSIRYEDKRIYVPNSQVFVKFTVRNESGGTYRFKLAENRMFNVDFDVRTLANVPLPLAAQFTTERTSNQQLYYRDVSLEPGEEFSFVEDLRDYVVLDRTGVYVVRANFYPNLVGGEPGALVQSNNLSLTIHPDLTQEESVAAMIDDRTGEVLSREALPPDEIVAYTITALQEGAWNRYFLYVDLEGLFVSNAARARSYSRLSDEAREARLVEFQSELESALVDPELSAVPTTFEMVRTTYDNDEATVIMDEEFRYPTYSEIKRYTYFLRRRDRVWYIYDYAVTNLGTE
jgi:hypothetical protein